MQQKAFQTRIETEAHWNDMVRQSDVLLVEVYSKMWGEASCYKQTLQRIYFAKSDQCKFGLAASEDIGELREFEEQALPHFLLYRHGRRIQTILGIKGPEIERAIENAC